MTKKIQLEGQISCLECLWIQLMSNTDIIKMTFTISLKLLFL